MHDFPKPKDFIIAAARNTRTIPGIGVSVQPLPSFLAQNIPVCSTASMLVTSSVQRSSFTIPTGFVPDPSLGTSRECMNRHGTETVAGTKNAIVSSKARSLQFASWVSRSLVSSTQPSVKKLQPTGCQLQTPAPSPMGYQPHQTDSWQPEASIHIRNIRRLIGSKLNQYFILTGTADVTIRTRVLAIIFTKYNQEFCLSLWDPGG